MWRGSRRSTKRVRTRVQVTHRATAQPTIASKRKRKKIIFAAVGVLMLLGLVVSLSRLSHADFISIKNIRVEGLTTMTQDEVVATMQRATQKSLLLGLYSQQNILSYPQHDLEKLLLGTYPRIRTVHITRRLFAREIIVSIVQREPYARWCTGDTESRECFVFDSTGFIFEPDIDTQDALTFFGGLDDTAKVPLRAMVDTVHIGALHTFIDSIALEGLVVKEVHIDGNDATLRIEPGWDLKVALDKDLRATSVNLSALLTEQHLIGAFDTIEYIDMRFDERVYIKDRTDK